MKTNWIQKIGVVIGLLGFITPVLAVNLNNHGVAFRAYIGTQTLDIDYQASGARNLASSPRLVIAPLVRSPTSDGSLAVYVDGVHRSYQTTTCTVYSHNYNGALLGSQSFTVALKGSFDRYVSLPGGQAPTWAYVSILCQIAGNGQVVMGGVAVVQ